MHSSRLCVVGPSLRFFAVIALLTGALSATSAFVAPAAQSAVRGAPAFYSGHHQEPAQSTPPAPSSTPTQVPADSSKGATAPSSGQESSSKGKPSSHAHDFLIRGTVFQPSGRAFPAVKLRIRRESEKKFRWQTLTNSRGEFAVRVPQGLQYEVAVAAKGFAEQTRQVDARSGISEENVAFRLEPAAGGKKK
jgi:hypothetical protein